MIGKQYSKPCLEKAFPGHSLVVNESPKTASRSMTITLQSGFPLVAFAIQLARKKRPNWQCTFYSAESPSKAAGEHKATGLFVGFIGHDAPARCDANGDVCNRAANVHIPQPVNPDSPNVTQLTEKGDAGVRYGHFSPGTTSSISETRQPRELPHCPPGTDVVQSHIFTAFRLSTIVQHPSMLYPFPERQPACVMTRPAVTVSPGRHVASMIAFPLPM